MEETTKEPPPGKKKSKRDVLLVRIRHQIQSGRCVGADHKQTRCRCIANLSLRDDGPEKEAIISAYEEWCLVLLSRFDEGNLSAEELKNLSAQMTNGRTCFPVNIKGRDSYMFCPNAIWENFSFLYNKIGKINSPFFSLNRMAGDCVDLQALLYSVSDYYTTHPQYTFIQWNKVAKSYQERTGAQMPRTDFLKNTYRNHCSNIPILGTKTTLADNVLKRLGGRILKMEDAQRTALQALLPIAAKWRAKPDIVGDSPVGNKPIGHPTIASAMKHPTTTHLSDQLEKAYNNHKETWDGLDAQLRDLFIRGEEGQPKFWQNHSGDPSNFSLYLSMIFTVRDVDPKEMYQRAHRDYRHDYNPRCSHQDHAQFPSIGFTPISKNGMFLQFWPGGEEAYHRTGEKQKGLVVFIPFGHLLVVPGDILHGGGFSCSEDGHPRLHFYFLPFSASVALKNEYKDKTSYSSITAKAVFYSDYCVDSPCLSEYVRESLFTSGVAWKAEKNAERSAKMGR